MKFASIDIGTNSILCLIAEYDNSKLQDLADYAEIVRLGEGLSENKRFKPEAMDRALGALIRFNKEINNFNIPRDNIFIQATEGMRKSSNSQEFIDLVKNKLDLKINIISGQTEAYLSFLGSINGLKNIIPDHGPYLIFDIGGGSTELILAQNQNEIQDSISLNLGSVWLFEKYLASHDPPRKEDLNELNKEIESILNNYYKFFDKISLIVGLAGTITNLASMDLKLEKYNPNLIHGHKLYKNNIKNILDKLKILKLSQRKKYPGLEPLRADVILAGISIAIKILELSKRDYLITCDHGLRHGAIYNYLKNKK